MQFGNNFGEFPAFYHNLSRFLLRFTTKIGKNMDAIRFLLFHSDLELAISYPTVGNRNSNVRYGKGAGKQT